MTQEDSGKKKKNPSPEILARELSKVSESPISVEMIRADIAAGAPVDEDGTMGLVEYAAWILKQGHDGV